eukprot:TRINITY_DN7186_c1_g1_i1.p1 TRINITY_DN7186_c1_g1~~TRINITY_DN7186_c1_g1_i1.p1  ORF type:complete len:239 (+),score=108.76 TRINITY_DN7186_c1_g1_i1:52-717(+)
MQWHKAALFTGGAVAVGCGIAIASGSCRPLLAAVFRSDDDDDEAILAVPAGVNVVPMTEADVERQMEADSTRELLEVLLQRNAGHNLQSKVEVVDEDDDDSDWEDVDSDEGVPGLEGYGDDDDDYFEEEGEEDAEAAIAQLMADPAFLRELVAQQQQVAADNYDDLQDLEDDMDGDDNEFLQELLARQGVMPKRPAAASRGKGVKSGKSAKMKKAGPKFKK